MDGPAEPGNQAAWDPYEKNISEIRGWGVEGGDVFLGVQHKDREGGSFRTQLEKTEQPCLRKDLGPEDKATAGKNSSLQEDNPEFKPRPYRSPAGTRRTDKVSVGAAHL
ncbi:hypothetical protein CB1_001699001 [Camelus ferus]|nr:hypothetical protein CB1_001699001 [Camelus ferus]